MQRDVTENATRKLTEKDTEIFCTNKTLNQHREYPERTQRREETLNTHMRAITEQRRRKKTQLKVYNQHRESLEAHTTERKKRWKATQEERPEREMTTK